MEILECPPVVVPDPALTEPTPAPVHPEQYTPRALVDLILRYDERLASCNGDKSALR